MNRASPSPARPPPIVPVIMAGGSGTRLWPLSREQHPKQFLPLLSERSLLQETLLRCARIDRAAVPLVIGAEAHRFLLAEQVQGSGVSATIVLEPAARGTAPVAAVAAHWVAQQHGPDALVLLVSADHTVVDHDRLLAAVRDAAVLAAQGEIVTFGIMPTRAETGFGYIRLGPPIPHSAGFKVGEFTEKPPADKAVEYVAAGNYRWNAGLFMFQAQRLLTELARLDPELTLHAHEALAGSSTESGLNGALLVRLAADAFKACREESIDVAVMEKAGNLAVVPLDAGWDDVASWTFLADLPPTDADGNCTRGDVVMHSSHGNLVHAGSRLVGLVGVDDCVVIETDDAVLVTPRERAQEVRHLVARLKEQQRPEAEARRRVYRPWGFYETVALGPRFQVKRIQVSPGQKLSLQMHHHRAEHWVIVSGTARVTCGAEEFLLSENESTYIPLGRLHRLENPGKVPLELIEVQSGAYLGEDDIVRFDDIYGRVAPSAEKPPLSPDAAAVELPEMTGAPAGRGSQPTH